MRIDLLVYRNQLRKIFEEEIIKWLRIRRMAIKRGCYSTADKIRIDVEKARRDMVHDDFFDEYRYTYLFKI